MRRIPGHAARLPVSPALASRPVIIWSAIAIIVVAVAIVIIVRPSSSSKPAPAASPIDSPQVSRAISHGRLVCGQKILDSPYTYHGPAGSYSSGAAGLPTYGKPGSDFPDATAGMVLPAGKHDYKSYQLRAGTVYYLLPGVHVGSFEADANDAFVGGNYGGKSTVMSGDYIRNSAIDSSFSDGDQRNVTIEYLTIEKFLANSSAATINTNSNTGWMIRNNTIRLNVPGAGVILGSDNVLKNNCLSQNGQYGFQAENTNAWGADSLTGGPYNLTVENNEISYNDTCDFEGLLDNPDIGWNKYNPVPEKYRNAHCGDVDKGNGNQGGFKLWRTNGVTIKDNYIHHNWGPGAWVDTNNANTTITGNTINFNDDAAIIEETSYNFSITNNYIAGNDIISSLGNTGFPSPAIYISESGSNTRLGGVPACAEASCRGQGSYRTQSVISGNTLVDNGGTVFLWQNSNRNCADGYDGVCTLLKGGASGPFTNSACKANWKSAAVDLTTYTGKLTGSPREDWWDGCMWKTENVKISNNIFKFNPAAVLHCDRDIWPDCGSGGMFSEYSSPPRNAPTWAIPTAITFFQNNVWSDNVYDGPSTFFAWNQGNAKNPVSWAQWSGKMSDGTKCGAASERQSGGCTGPFGQDAGSTYK